MKAKKTPASKLPSQKSKSAKAPASAAKPAAKAAKATGKSASPKPVAIGEILVPVDFSDHSREALRYALDFAQRFGSKVALIHVIEQVVYPGDWVFAPVTVPQFVESQSDDFVSRLREFAGAAGDAIIPVVKVGRPWQQVVEVANKRKSSMIITATHGYTGLKHVLLGSVAEKIVQHAHCPVLTIRMK